VGSGKRPRLSTRWLVSGTSEDGFHAGEDERDGSGNGVVYPGAELHGTIDSKEGCWIKVGGDFRGAQFLGVKIWLVERA